MSATPCPYRASAYYSKPCLCATCAKMHDGTCFDPHCEDNTCKHGVDFTPKIACDEFAAFGEVLDPRD